MLRVILGSILSAILMFVWGFVVWGIVATMLPDKLGRFRPYKELPAEAQTAVLSAMQGVEPGTYQYPPMDFSTKEAQEESEKLAAAGPFLLIGHGTNIQQNVNITYAIGFAHMLFAAFLMGSLLRIAAPAIKSFGSRMFFIVAMGLTGTVYILGRDIIWYHQEMGHYFFLAGYYLGSFILAGIVLGAMIRPEDA